MHVARYVPLLFICIFLNSAQAEETKEKVTGPSAGRAPSVRIDVTPFTITPEVPGTFRVPFRLSNGSASQLVLERFDARFLVPSGAHKEMLTTEGSNDQPANCEKRQISIPPNGEGFVFCEFQPTIAISTPLDLIALTLNWATLTIRPGDYQLFAVATFSEHDDEGELLETHSASTVATIPLRPTVWQVIIGVGLGALLLALFKFWSPNARHDLGIDSEKLSRAAAIKLFLKFWISGWIAGAMIVFMTFRMKDVGFPVSITVTDFYGGVVVGLFSYIAGTWLVKKVLTDASKSSVDAAAKKA